MKNSLLKEDESHQKIVRHNKRQKKALKEEKENQKMGKYQRTKFFFFTDTILCIKVYIFLKHKFGKTLLL